MKKTDVEKVSIDIEADGQSALSLMLCKDGTVGRQGNGSLPPHRVSVLGITDGSEFRQVMEMFDERLFDRQGIYDHPNKQGLRVKYSVVFLGTKPHFRQFEFRLGLENEDVGDLLPYFDGLIKKTIAITEDWYAKALTEDQKKQQAKTSGESTKKPWWQSW